MDLSGCCDETSTLKMRVTTHSREICQNSLTEFRHFFHKYPNEIRQDRFLDCRDMGCVDSHASLFHVRHDRAPGSSWDHASRLLLRICWSGSRVAARLCRHCSRSFALSHDDAPVCV